MSKLLRLFPSELFVCIVGSRQQSGGDLKKVPYVSFAINGLLQTSMTRHEPSLVSLTVSHK